LKNESVGDFYFAFKDTDLFLVLVDGQVCLFYLGFGQPEGRLCGYALNRMLRVCVTKKNSSFVYASIRSLDHLVYGVPDLEEGIDHLEKLLGVRAVFGGQHKGIGTHNALLALSKNSYLEIIAPDPLQQPYRHEDRHRFGKSMWFGMHNLSQPKLLTFAIKSNRIAEQLKQARQLGFPLGDVQNGSRDKPDGTRLSWQLTNPSQLIEGGIVPFLIDWGESAHPAESMSATCELISLEATHPLAEDLNQKLSAMNVWMKCSKGEEKKLMATLKSPNGVVMLS